MSLGDKCGNYKTNWLENNGQNRDKFVIKQKNHSSILPKACNIRILLLILYLDQ